jgi:predicted dithiol-disulfide oxidoreductase (DUF899 family)
MAKPNIVSAAEWKDARAALLVEEKRLTHELDALAAKRRRLPMVELENKYKFAGPRGSMTLLDLFDGREQLIQYQFMDRGPDKFCPGCTGFTNNIATNALPHLNRLGVSWCNVSNMPLAQIEAYKAKQGWTIPFVSSHGTTFTADTGANDLFLLSVFLRDGNKIYRTYSTTRRGVDRLLFTSNFLDLTPWGRQEEWESSPEGWPRQKRQSVES